MFYDWTLYYMDVYTSYSYLISYLEELLDFYAASKINIIRSTKKNLVLWMTRALFQCNRKCRKLYIKSSNSLESKNMYFKYRNVLNRLKQIRKKEYFHNKITSFKGDSNQLWEFLKG